MKIIISPAKSIDTKRKISVPKTSTGEFLNEAEYLIQKLKKFSVKKIEKLMHVSKDIAVLNHDRFQNWQRPESVSDEIAPAITAFTGEVYRGIAVESWSDKDFQFAQNNLRILSGLFGILRPLDLIFPYRLEMGTRWSLTPKTTNLYKYWGSQLAESMNDEMQKDEVIINLASAEYFKALDKKMLKPKMITPVFKEFKNGDYKIVMMFAKNARGTMARYIIQNEITDPEKLKLYTENGYSFDAKQSSELEWVFVR